MCVCVCENIGVGAHPYSSDPHVLLVSIIIVWVLLQALLQMEVTST